MPPLIKSPSEWSQSREASKVAGKMRGYVTLPAFDAGFVPRGVVDNNSSLMLQFNYQLDNNFVFNNVSAAFNETDHVFMLCVKYVTYNSVAAGSDVQQGRRVFRYMLWCPPSYMIYRSRNVAEDYKGEVIKKNFSLEIWSFGFDVDIDKDYQMDVALPLDTSIKKVRRNINDDSTQNLYTGVSIDRNTDLTIPLPCPMFSTQFSDTSVGPINNL